MKRKTGVREMVGSEVPFMVDYFLNSDDAFLAGMGVDVNKLPDRNEWIKMVKTDFQLPLNTRKYYYVTWLLNDQPIGHSNINKIIFEQEAYMHLHMWQMETRNSGLGYEFVQRSLPFYFRNFKIKELFCEPYAFNPAPNNILKRLGFELISQYETIPGWINSLQLVNRWRLKTSL